MRRPHNTPLAEDKHGCYGANAPLRPNVTHSEGQHTPTSYAHRARTSPPLAEDKHCCYGACKRTGEAYCYTL
eukprot:scaffold58239_cov62-Phaeocystis_antarctica.AAC.5